jgi:mRNA interferase RelE/StbE
MKVLFTGSFASDLRKHKKSKQLLGRIQRIVESVEQAEAVTELTNPKHLKAEGGYYRFRVGDYRMGVTIDSEQGTVIFIRVLHRKEICRFFP